jgi:hypothetical protein
VLALLVPPVEVSELGEVVNDVGDEPLFLHEAVIRLREKDGVTHAAGWMRNNMGTSMIRTTCHHWFAGSTWWAYRVEREETVTCVRCVVQG